MSKGIFAMLRTLRANDPNKKNIFFIFRGFVEKEKSISIKIESRPVRLRRTN